MALTLIKAAPAWSKRPSQSAFAKLHDDTRDDLLALARKFGKGEIGAQEWYIRFSNTLVERHKDAWTLGRRLSGDVSPEGIADELAGRAKADQESEWLLNFYHDLETGKYLDPDGNLKLNVVEWRSGLYASKLRGTANEAFIETSDDAEEFEWKLGGVELHCSDCPELSSMSPWLKDELGAWPGSGGTPCLGNCKCSLVRVSDGLSGFLPV